MDAAALAGASAFLIADPLVNKTVEAEARAREYATKHTVHTAPITDPQITVDLSRPDTITVTYAGPQFDLWFGHAIGIPTMAINAAATARAFETSNASCVMPVALPDVWQNNDIAGAGKNDPPEERGTPDGIWSYED